MMDFINIIFRSLDFFVVVGVAMFGIKNYLVPMVEKMLREYGVFIYNLESDCKDLQIQTQSIYENIQDQDRQFQAMQARFAIWQKKCEERLVLQKLAQEKIDEAIRNRFVLRSNCIKKDRMIQDQLPSIINSVTKTLQGKYQGSDNQKEYIETLIQVMKEQS